MQNPGIFRILVYLELEANSETVPYLKHCQTSTMKRFAKKGFHYFCNL